MDTHLFWSALQEPGMEHLHLVEDESGVRADSLVLGLDDGAPFRLWYQVRADAAWTVRECRFQVGGEQGAVLRLVSDGQGHWTDAAGGAYPALEGCADVDITVTPFTNTLPIRRLTLAPSASAELLVAYVTIPELSVRPARQRYTCLSRTEVGAVYRYEGLESGFRADLTVDAQGLVIAYPNLWQRVWMR
jgi:hypothetical protein